MKTYQRATKNVQSEAWQSRRTDFNAQAQEAYTNMNQQVMSSKMSVMQGPPAMK